MRHQEYASCAESAVEPHRFKKSTQAARAAAWDTYDLDDLETMELPQHAINSLFQHSRRRDAHVFRR